tara:strand:+ start:3905 stop:7129 length:3225 start_codon:yes stop_codon:yes gene_type:complete
MGLFNNNIFRSLALCLGLMSFGSGVVSGQDLKIELLKQVTKQGISGFNELDEEVKIDSVKLISKNYNGKKLKQDVDLIPKKHRKHVYGIRFNSLDDIVSSVDLVSNITQMECYNPGYIEIKFSGETFRFEIKYTIDDFENNIFSSSLFFLYHQNHWNQGNLWSSLTACIDEKVMHSIDYKRLKYCVLVGGFHNTKKEFGNLQDFLLKYNYIGFEFNYPNDQDIRLSAWLLNDALDCLEKINKISQVSIIGHSMGNLVTRAYIQGMATEIKKENNLYKKINVPYKDNIDNFIALSPPNDGSNQAYKIVFEGIWAWLEEFIRGFNPIAPAYKQLAIGSEFLWELNQDFIKNFEEYSKIPMLIIAGNDANLAPGSKIFIPETKAEQGDGFVSVSSASLPGVPTIIVPETHATIKGTNVLGEPLTLEEYKWVFEPIISFLSDSSEFVYDETKPNIEFTNVVTGRKVRYATSNYQEFNGGILLKTNGIENLVMCGKNNNYFFVEDIGEKIKLSEYTVNTNPDIYSEVPVAIDSNSKDPNFFFNNRARFKKYFSELLKLSGPKPNFGLPAGEYTLHTFEQKQNLVDRLKFWSDEESIIINPSSKKIIIKPGQFTMAEVDVESLIDKVEKETVKVAEKEKIKKKVEKDEPGFFSKLSGALTDKWEDYKEKRKEEKEKSKKEKKKKGVKKEKKKGFLSGMFTSAKDKRGIYIEDLLNDDELTEDWEIKTEECIDKIYEIKLKLDRKLEKYSQKWVPRTLSEEISNIVCPVTGEEYSYHIYSIPYFADRFNLKEMKVKGCYILFCGAPQLHNKRMIATTFESKLLVLEKGVMIDNFQRRLDIKGDLRDYGPHEIQRFRKFVDEYKNYLINFEPDTKDISFEYCDMNAFVDVNEEKCIYVISEKRYTNHLKKLNKIFDEDHKGKRVAVEYDITNNHILRFIYMDSNNKALSLNEEKLGVEFKFIEPYLVYMTMGFQIDCFQKFLSPESRMVCATFISSDGNYEMAIRLAEDIFRKFPTNITFKYQLAEIYFEKIRDTKNKELILKAKPLYESIYLEIQNPKYLREKGMKDSSQDRIRTLDNMLD